MTITVVVTTWQVPFAQAVKEVFHTNDDVEALKFINSAAHKWWDENCVGEDTESKSTENEDGSEFEPIKELGYEWARWELWGGEVGFHALLDEATENRLHEEHYKREYDDKGISRPGYFRNAYGEDTSAEQAEVQAYYSGEQH